MIRSISLVILGGVLLVCSLSTAKADWFEGVRSFPETYDQVAGNIQQFSNEYGE